MNVRIWRTKSTTCLSYSVLWGECEDSCIFGGNFATAP